jgi:hypothetical protein
MILSLMIAMVIVLLAWVTSEDIVLYVTGRYSLKDYGTDIGNMVESFMAILIRGLVLFFYLKIYRYLVLIILSPVFVKVSEILHKNIDGRRPGNGSPDLLFLFLPGYPDSAQEFCF